MGTTTASEKAEGREERTTGRLDEDKGRVARRPRPLFDQLNPRFSLHHKMEPPPVPPAAHPLSALNRRARRRIRNAKNKARPELKTKEMWYEKRYFENFDLRWQHVNDTIERIDV